MQKMIEWIEENYISFQKTEIYRKAIELRNEEKIKEQHQELIRFVRLSDKMGKSVEDLYNEFINQNK